MIVLFYFILLDLVLLHFCIKGSNAERSEAQLLIKKDAFVLYAFIAEFMVFNGSSIIKNAFVLSEAKLNCC